MSVVSAQRLARGRTISIPVRGGAMQTYVAVPDSGSGPGLLLLQEIFGVNSYVRSIADQFAEEGYTVVAPDLFWRLEPGVELGHGEADMKTAFDLLGRFDVVKAVEDIAATAAALRAMRECSGKIGALGFCLGGKLAYLAAARAGVDAAVSYYGVGIETALDEAARIRCPMVLHFAGADRFVPPAAVERIRAAFAGRNDVAIYEYPGVDHAFANSERPAFDKPSTRIAHGRTLALLRKALGPEYDLAALWEKHLEFEFGSRDVPATMATMVEEPYVNHVPTMTGGVGQKELARFYRNHFVNSNPADTRIIPVSRTIGTDRIVDEMIFCFTHDREIDWMLPGVPPTGKYVEVPLVGIVCFRGPKLYHEHIYWDQASVLKQIGLLNDERMPVGGAESAKKVLDETLRSNTLMQRWRESEGR